MNIGIFIYNNAEVLDFSGPFEVFSTAKRLSNCPWNIFFIAEHLQPIVARGGMQVIPHYHFAHHPPIDVLMVVGGVHTEEQTKPAVQRWISQVAPSARYVTSVCTGAFLLASAGVIAQHKVTTHWEDAEELARQFPKLIVDRQARWVQDGNVVTSAGISAGIDMSLFLVSALADRRLADMTAKQMDYRWIDG
jgi:transcriptional regulator GlxA family with amidase domain